MSIIKGLKNYILGTQNGAEVHPDQLEPRQITEAKKYLGKHEILYGRLLTSLLGFDPTKMAWCAGFVNAIEKKCGRLGTGKLSARSYLAYGTPVNKPELGDIVIFKRGKLPWQGHVGYYILRDSNGILVLGGNQNNKVCYKYYDVSDVLGYRKP